jgi:hypothetical protein
MVDLTADEPTLFWTAADEPKEGWRTTPLSNLIRSKDSLKFDVEDPDYLLEDRFTPMTLTGDGPYHHRSGEKCHWWGILSENSTHTILTGNWIDENSRRGVFIGVWPKPSK